MPRRLDAYDPVSLQETVDALPARRLDDETLNKIEADFKIELRERETMRSLGKLGAKLVELAVAAAKKG